MPSRVEPRDWAKLVLSARADFAADRGVAHAVVSRWLLTVEDDGETSFAEWLHDTGPKRSWAGAVSRRRKLRAAAAARPRPRRGSIPLPLTRKHQPIR